MLDACQRGHMHRQSHHCTWSDIQNLTITMHQIACAHKQMISLDLIKKDNIT
jgi:hypothetical protein